MTKVAESRKAAAEQRKAERAARTPKQQLERLDKLLGPGVGAVKERAKLQKLLEVEAVEEAKAIAAKKSKGKKGDV